MRQVKEALFVLIQHNLVQYKAATDEDSTMKATLYRIDIDASILRLAYPIFYDFLKRHYGNDSKVAELFQDVLKNGRLAVDSTLKTSLEKVVTAGLLEYVCGESSVYESVPSLKRKIESPSKKRVTMTTLHSPIKMKRSKLNVAPESDELLFVRINVDGFLRSLFQENLVKHVSCSINESAGVVIDASLAVLGGKLDSSTTFGSFQVGARVPTDYKLLVDNRGGNNMSSEKPAVSQYLDYFCQNLGFFERIDHRADGLYHIDFEKAIECLRLASIEAYVRSKFGQASLRILRILQDRKMLEEKTISKLAMVSPKETRERLYILLDAGMVALQEVPKTLDHAPSRTFYLWHIPLSSVYASFSTMHLKAAVNLLDRLQSECTSNKTLIAKSERSDVVANPTLLNQTERRQLSFLRNSLNRLTFTLQSIMREYLLFCKV